MDAQPHIYTCLEANKCSDKESRSHNTANKSSQKSSAAAPSQRPLILNGLKGIQAFSISNNLHCKFYGEDICKSAKQSEVALRCKQQQKQINTTETIRDKTKQQKKHLNTIKNTFKQSENTEQNHTLRELEVEKKRFFLCPPITGVSL